MRWLVPPLILFLPPIVPLCVQKAGAYYSSKMADAGIDWPPTHQAADDAHFAKLRRERGVHQIWLISEDNGGGGQYVQHNFRHA